MDLIQLLRDKKYGKKYDLKDEIEWQRRIDQEAANERIIKF